MPALIPIIVGEDNPVHSHPRYALYPKPVGCAGFRLATKIFDMDLADYMNSFLRYNLCTGAWSAQEAKRRAEGLNLLYAPNPKILLGRKVANSFDLRGAEPFSLHRWALGTGRGPVLCLPHPSGRCHVWNDPTAVKLARRRLKELLK